MQNKQIHPWFRNAFHAGSFLSLMAGIQLFVLSEKTDIYFAWTIQSSLTAATLGGFYFGSMTFGYLSARESTWSNVRGPAVGLFLFLVGTLAATVLQLDKFHLASENPLTRFVTWVWLAIYILLPLVLTASFFLQSRLSGNDPERTSILPIWFRWLLFLHGVIGVLLSFVLFFLPDTMLPIWAWALTPLTARALSAWFISFGIVDLISLWENDWRRLKVTSISYTITSTFGLLSLMRYAGQADLGGVAGIGYGLYLLIMLGMGLYGWRMLK
jgi:hypothetical protein